MSGATAVRGFIGSIFIIAGVIWSIKFPKTADIFRPDFVASIAIGTGLILGGAVILFLKKSRIVPGILSIFLVWSILLNLFLFSCAKHYANAVQKISQNSSNMRSK